jgi:hypothetical protein
MSRHSVCGHGQPCDGADMERNRFWNRLLRRNCTDSGLWPEGRELSRKADLISIALLQEQLRNFVLPPGASLSDIRTDHDKQELVRFGH